MKKVKVQSSLQMVNLRRKKNKIKDNSVQTPTVIPNDEVQKDEKTQIPINGEPKKKKCKKVVPEQIPVNQTESKKKSKKDKIDQTVEPIVVVVAEQIPVNQTESKKKKKKEKSENTVEPTVVVAEQILVNQTESKKKKKKEQTVEPIVVVAQSQPTEIKQKKKKDKKSKQIVDTFSSALQTSPSQPIATQTQEIKKKKNKDKTQTNLESSSTSTLSVIPAQTTTQTLESVVENSIKNILGQGPLTCKQFKKKLHKKLKGQKDYEKSKLENLIVNSIFGNNGLESIIALSLNAQ